MSVHIASAVPEVRCVKCDRMFLGITICSERGRPHHAYLIPSFLVLLSGYNGR